MSAAVISPCPRLPNATIADPWRPGPTLTTGCAVETTGIMGVEGGAVGTGATLGVMAGMGVAAMTGVCVTCVVGVLGKEAGGEAELTASTCCPPAGKGRRTSGEKQPATLLCNAPSV